MGVSIKKRTWMARIASGNMHLVLGLIGNSWAFALTVCAQCLGNFKAGRAVATNGLLSVDRNLPIFSIQTSLPGCANKPIGRVGDPLAAHFRTSGK